MLTLDNLAKKHNFNNNEQTINQAIKETLKDLIQETRENYPATLKTKHIIEITNCTQSQLYEYLIKKIQRWRNYKIAELQYIRRQKE